MKKSIEVFIGSQGSGKSYSASAFTLNGFSVVKSFADPVYLMAHHMVSQQMTERLYNSRHEFKNETFVISGVEMRGRQVLQMIGEGARLVNSNVWISKMRATMSDIFYEKGKNGHFLEYAVCIDDCRYPNEVLALIEYAGIIGASINFHHCTYNTDLGKDIPGERMANHFCVNEFSYENLLKYCIENA